MQQVAAALIISLAVQAVLHTTPFGPVQSYNVTADPYIAAWLVLPSCPENATIIVNGVPLAAGPETVEVDPGPPCNVTLRGLPILYPEPGTNITILLEGAWGSAGLIILAESTASGNETNTPVLWTPGKAGNTSLYTGSQAYTVGGAGSGNSLEGGGPDLRLAAAAVLGAAAVAVAVREYGGRVEGG